MEKRLTSKMDKQLRVATGTFEALVRSQPDISGPTVVRDLQQLAWLLGLPTQDLRPAYEALAQPEALHQLHAGLVRLAKKSGAQEGKAEAYQAAVAAWCAACDQPRTAAEWLEEAALAREVLKCFVVNSQPHRAFRLWLALCAAAAQDAASPGIHGAVLSVLHSKPPPLMWQPEMAVAAALAGCCQDEFELDLPVEVQRTPAASKVKVGEVKAAANAMGVAKVHLERAVRLFAWLHAVLGLPQPEYVGCVVVPHALKAEASRSLGHSLQKEVEVPQGRGKVSVTWQLCAV